MYRAFCIVDKYILDYAPVAFASTGLWMGEGHIFIIGRYSKMGSICRGENYVDWDAPLALAVAIAPLTNEGVATVTMDGLFQGFTKQVL